MCLYFIFQPHYLSHCNILSQMSTPSIMVSMAFLIMVLGLPQGHEVRKSCGVTDVRSKLGSDCAHISGYPHDQHVTLIVITHSRTRS